MKRLHKIYWAIKAALFLHICETWLNGYYSELRLAYKWGFDGFNGYPIRCWLCGDKNFEEKNKYYINEGQVCEYEVRCKNCDHQVGYWAYGNWQI